MNTLRLVLVVLHLLGMAAILSGYVAQRSGGKGMDFLVWGARAQLLTGLLLVGVIEMGSLFPVNNTKIGIKLLVSIAVVACAEIANARAKKGEPNPQLVTAAAGLTVLNVLVATLWGIWS